MRKEEAKEKMRKRAESKPEVVARKREKDRKRKEARRGGVTEGSGDVGDQAEGELLHTVLFCDRPMS